MTTNEVSKAIVKATTNLEREWGGREAVVDVLRYLPEESRFRTLADALSDPDNDDLSIALLCANLGIKPSQILTIFRDARAAKALAESMDQVYSGLPRVAGTAMKLGHQHDQLCSVCEGIGSIDLNRDKEEEEPKLERCKRCNGRGRVVYTPDNERVKTALEIGGLLKKSQTNITIDQSKKQMNVFNSGQLRDFLAASDKALRVTRVIPTEPIPNDDD